MLKSLTTVFWSICSALRKLGFFLLLSEDTKSTVQVTLLCPYLGSLTVASSSEMYVVSDDVGSFAFFLVAAVRIKPLTGIIKMKKLRGVRGELNKIPSWWEMCDSNRNGRSLPNCLLRAPGRVKRINAHAAFHGWFFQKKHKGLFFKGNRAALFHLDC